MDVWSRGRGRDGSWAAKAAGFECTEPRGQLGQVCRLLGAGLNPGPVWDFPHPPPSAPSPHPRTKEGGAGETSLVRGASITPRGSQRARWQVGDRGKGHLTLGG
jgi:hypothetical protein